MSHLCGLTKYYLENIEKVTLENTEYRKIVYTDENMQLVLMSIPPGGNIELEAHEIATQFVRVERGHGKVSLYGMPRGNQPVTWNLFEGSAVVVPQNTRHYFENMSTADDLKLYTIYSPPVHGVAVSIGAKREGTSSSTDLIAARQKASEKAVSYAEKIKRKDCEFDFGKVQANAPIQFFEN